MEKIELSSILSKKMASQEKFVLSVRDHFLFKTVTTGATRYMSVAEEESYAVGIA